MGSSEKFCLRWNDFEANLGSAFRDLKDEKELFDITLACEDDQIQAHKLILSACSPFFKKILKRNRHEHPLIYLKWVKITDLQAVLNFIYHGEVSVAQEDLNSFLTVAEDLKVKGLTQQNSQETSTLKTQQNIGKHQSSKSAMKESGPCGNRSRSLTEQKKPSPSENKITAHHYETEVQEVVPIKAEPEVYHTDSHGSAPLVDSQPNSIISNANTTVDNSLTAYHETYNDYEQYEDGSDFASSYDNTSLAATDGEANQGMI